MSKVQTIVNIILEQQKHLLAPSTYEARKNYLKDLISHADAKGITDPCQELYDSYVVRATTPDLRFQLFHAIRLVDKEAGTKALTPKGKLYNEPEIPPVDEVEKLFCTVNYPISDKTVDTGCLIRRAEQEMQYLQLSSSTSWQYMQAWREMYTFLYLQGDTMFARDRCIDFIEDANKKYLEGVLHEWKRKIRRRAALVLIEVADTGHFKWKMFTSRKVCCQEETLEDLRQQYSAFLQTQNLENKTISLYDYSFRIMMEGLGIKNVSDLGSLNPQQIQSMLVFLSERLGINSRGTVFPIVRQILSYLYSAGLTETDFSGMILSPAYHRVHLRPYMTASDEEKLFRVIEDSPLRNKAMMRMALRLGLRDTDICNLRFSQIDWKNDRIILEQEKTGVTLYLPLLEDVGNAIMDYIMNERPAAANDCPFVFVRKLAPYKKLESMYMVCSRLFEEANIKTVNRDSRGTHVCRYTLTHKLLLKKVPHQVITDTLGHVSKESDKPYLSMEEQMLRECPLGFSLIGQKYWEEGENHV
ncbi:MAG: tyrosine-type recombinase/integrase [Lachnospiraceae bacterium]|nr:tyrosine-type recombinase/integrase [Lachnospiraceae bacterium]